MSEAEVLFEERGSIGLVTLNRPKALNSLTHGMCVAITERLGAWANLNHIKAVVVVGAGEKAFCAGGDVVRVSKSVAEGTREWRDFFHDEYLMNIAIDEFPKPYIAIVDGITMGGGVGVSIPGDYWIATEKTMFAMPETGLGLIPDVGGGWFLPRMPGETGMYLALTGARIKAPDLYALGLASHVVASSDVDALISAIAEMEIEEKLDIERILDHFHKDPEPATLSPVFDDIDDHFGGESVDAIMSSLSNDQSDWAQKQFQILSSKSPMSMKVTFEQLKRGSAMENFRDNMRMEFRLVSRLMDGKDFHEGVRAILLDKDNKPQWNPVSLWEVSDEAVEAHFADLGVDELAI